MWSALIVGVVLAPFVGHLVRRGRIAGARRAMDHARQKADRDKKRVEEEAQKKCRAVDRAADKSKDPLRSRLEAIERQRKELVESSKTKEREIKQEHDERMGQWQREADKEIQAFREAVRASMSGKPKGAMKEFPVFQNAKRLGFKEGKRPPESQIDQMMKRELDKLVDPLDNVARIVLQQLFQRLDGDQLEGIVQTLSKLSPAERNRRLHGMFNT